MAKKDASAVFYTSAFSGGASRSNFQSFQSFIPQTKSNGECLTSYKGVSKPSPSSNHCGYLTDLDFNDEEDRVEDQVDGNKPAPNNTSSTSSPEKVIGKFQSVWNNVKYGWTVRPKTNFSKDSPIWMLGIWYHRKVQAPNQRFQAQGPLNSADSASAEFCFSQFREDFTSRFWFTYRRQFQILPGSQLTTDCGWGCMLRSGQMILAQALVCHILGRQWRWQTLHSEASENMHRMIVRWFGDKLSDICPFSIHRLVLAGMEGGKKAGDWYGPSSVAYILKDVVEEASKWNKLLSNVCVYVAQDCTVYIDDVLQLCSKVKQGNTDKVQKNCSSQNDANMATSLTNFETKSIGVQAKPNHFSNSSDNLASSEKANCVPSQSLKENGGVTGDISSLIAGLSTDSGEKWQSVVILVPVRLGGEKINPAYIPVVKALLAFSQCIGIIGGKPKHSLYFVGWQDEKVIYMDPHYCQETVDIESRNFPLETFHCGYPRKMLFTNMDPSCTIGFYCKTKKDFLDFIKNVHGIIGSTQEYPVFLVTRGHCSTSTSLNKFDEMSEQILKVHRNVISSDGVLSTSSEDYVLL